MTDSYAITGVRVQDNFALNDQAVSVLRKRVTFYVGSNGPFTLDYSPGEYTADKVRADMEKEVETLRAIGATRGA